MTADMNPGLSRCWTCNRKVPEKHFDAHPDHAQSKAEARARKQGQAPSSSSTARSNGAKTARVATQARPQARTVRQATAAATAVLEAPWRELNTEDFEDEAADDAEAEYVEEIPTWKVLAGLGAFVVACVGMVILARRITPPANYGTVASYGPVA